MEIKDFQYQKDRQHKSQNLKKPKVVIKDRPSQKNTQHKGQKFEGTKTVNQRSSIKEGQTTQEPKA